jgi:FkbM family methyltransferase
VNARSWSLSVCAMGTWTRCLPQARRWFRAIQWRGRPGCGVGQEFREALEYGVRLAAYERMRTLNDDNATLLSAAAGSDPAPPALLVSAAAGGGLQHCATWGLSIRCRPDEDIGYALHTTGIYDLLLTELICRSVERGERVVDAGANIGYATSLMAVLAGLRGKVYAFEPHPQIFLELRGNVEPWLRDPRVAAVELFESALSESSGTATLREPHSGFEANSGVSSLARKVEGSSKAYTVRKQRLDATIPRDEAIGVWKIDVEGHELAAFEGARLLLRSRRIRDIIFEEFAPYPAPTHRLLEDSGYTIFHLESWLFGPSLRRTGPGYQPPVYSPPNFLATLDPDRMAEKFRTRGWNWLSAGRTKTIA